MYNPWHMSITPVPIGYGATISQPYIVALITAVSKKHRILEIETGSGYQAAILGQLSAEVYAVEIVPELAQSAAKRLRELGYMNVSVRHGDGYKGWPEGAPFDAIIITAALPEIPSALIAQLAPKGRLLAPVGRAVQDLIVLEKRSDGTIMRRSVCPVTFVIWPMKQSPR
jgi:protein-L-isoaspartate(D-aspartate) O-methyltransferase